MLLSFRREKDGVVLLRLHRMFLHAPLGVVRAVARGLRAHAAAAPTARCGAS